MGNTVAQFIHDKDWGMAVASAVFFPVMLIVYPFVHHAPDVSLWPVGPQDNVTAVLIGALVVAFVAHLLSTTVGGMDPVE